MYPYKKTHEHVCTQPLLFYKLFVSPTFHPDRNIVIDTHTHTCTLAPQDKFTNTHQTNQNNLIFGKKRWCKFCKGLQQKDGFFFSFCCETFKKVCFKMSSAVVLQSFTVVYFFLSFVVYSFKSNKVHAYMDIIDFLISFLKHKLYSHLHLLQTKDPTEL